MPEPLITKEGTKIMDLQNPTAKMSKSSENKKGVICLLEDLATVRKKIMSATTDSDMEVRFDPENKPGISNLINIYAALTGITIKEVEEKFVGANYGTFKKEVADVVVNELEGIQTRYKEIVGSEYLNGILDKGVNRTIELFKNKYEDMKQKIGLQR